MHREEERGNGLKALSIRYQGSTLGGRVTVTPQDFLLACKVDLCRLKSEVLMQSSEGAVAKRPCYNRSG
jgi:hypothetical protein